MERGTACNSQIAHNSTTDSFSHIFSAVIPPTMSEVKAALSAGDPTARRRRRSSAITPIPTEETAKQSSSPAGFRGRLAGTWERLRKLGRGSEAEGGGEGKYDATGPPRKGTPSGSHQGSEHGEYPGSPAFFASTTRPRGSSDSSGMSPRKSSRLPAGRHVSGRLAPTTPGGFAPPGPSASASQPLRRASLDREAVAAPRRASLEGSDNRRNGDEIARLELTRQENPRYSSRAGLPGLPPSSLFAKPAAEVDVGAATTDGWASPASPIRSSVIPRRDGSGGGGDGAGSPKRGQPATAAAPAPRIPIEDFEMCAGGNFAVFLALRWEGNFSGSTSGESGFAMLVRLALREASHFGLGSFTHWWPQAERPPRKERPDSGRSHRIIAKERNRRHNNMSSWDMSATKRPGSRLKGVAGWAGSGSPQPSAAVAGGRHIPALITGILREHFLAQVGNWFRTRAYACWALTGGVLRARHLRRHLAIPVKLPCVRTNTFERVRQRSTSKRIALCAHRHCNPWGKPHGGNPTRIKSVTEKNKIQVELLKFAAGVHIG